jgi:lysophospholipase L1-like esterase
MKNFRLCAFSVAGALVIGSQLTAQSTSVAVDSSTARLELPATDDGLPGAGPIRRYDWFRNLWLQRRSEFAGAKARDQNAIVFLGDSITQGWGDLPSTFPGVKTANRGISGDTTRGVLIRLQEDVLALNPRGVVLLIGTNDLEEWAAPEIVAGNLKLILDALKAHNATMPVVLCAVMPSSQSKNRPVVQIKKLNQLYAQLLKDQPQVTLLDTWSLFANGDGDAKPEEFPDLLHPNGIGYAKWAAAIRPILETTGLVPAWPDDFQCEAGFTPLFNGKDLTGWSYHNEDLAGKTSTSDGRFIARNGRLVVTVARVARDYQRIATAAAFPKDFVLKLEFRASPNADSGIFLREPQLQCRDYPLAGPFTNLRGYRSLEWNEIVVTVHGGIAHATCNGEVLVDSIPLPPTGPIALESDHGQMEYRRIRIHELQ